MGARLHYAQHFDPDWQGGFFNRDLDAWDKLYEDKFVENGWRDENNLSHYAVARHDLVDYLSQLEYDGVGEMNEYFTDYTNQQVIDLLTQVLTSDDDLIHVSWY